jgi:transcriptional regulator
VYQPSHGRFGVQDPAALLADLCARVPATLVSRSVDGFRVSILPMLFDAADGEPGEHGEHGTLRGHVARANPHWRSLAEDREAVAIFNDAEAYVTPSWYPEKARTGNVVPTWNYTTVVVHGRVRVRDEPDWLLAHVRRLVDRHEASRAEPWSVDDAPDGYVEKQARAIVGLELVVTAIEAKRKLSQNRVADDFEGVIDGLAGGSPTEQAVAAAMRRESPRR